MTSDELFEVRPEDFVRERDALAKQLRDEGRADEAKEVRRRRRPTMAVWALNQLARRRPKDVEAVLAAGEDVRDAQERGAGERLRTASRELHARASKVAASAAELAGSARPAELEHALRTAALQGDPDGELRAGRLRELPEASFDADMWRAGAVEADPKDAEERPELAAEIEEARVRHAQAESDLDAARTRVDELQEQLATARDELTDARDRAKETKRELQRLERRA